MAILAPLDWQQTNLPKDKTMEVPTNSKQRSSPANEPQNHPPQQQGQLQQFQQQHPPHHQPSFTYPIQQQPQGSWTPSIAAAPFYPSFYQNQQHHSPQAYPQQVPQHPGYFDQATNAQLAAQWAYQQMMYNAQHTFPQQQQRSPSGDYYAQNQINHTFSPFPSGTPPPHRSNSTDHQQQQGGQPNQFGGFHPYRRPNKQNQQTQPHPQHSGVQIPPQPPYKRPDASGSSSSINSSHSQRQRTNSTQSGASGHTGPSSAAGSIRGRNHPPSTSIPNRNSPSPAPSTGSAPASQLRLPHHRNASSSSSSSNRPSGISPPPPSSTTTTSSATASSSHSNTTLAAPIPRPARPSPLSQGNFTASERRMSRDDSVLDSTPASAARSNGLKGRLRRALSFNPVLKEGEASDDESIKASNYTNSNNQKSKSSTTNNPGKSSGPNGVPSSGETAGDDSASTATVQTKKKSRAASLFNARLNASTDNISLSSTVSSASVMIRKLGSMGRLARRNSLAGITSLFKDKDKDKGKKKDKKGGAKGEASEASVSHVTAELDRTGGDWNSADMNGLSPAAKLARQHTLKSNAEAAARAKAQQEAAAEAAAEASANGANGAGVPTWDKDTAKRQATSPLKSGSIRVNEDGSRILVEEDDDDSDDGHHPGVHPVGQNFKQDGWDDDEDWDIGDDDDEDTTIRLGMGRASLEDPEDEHEPWAFNIRRSEERARQPAKGILKNADTYDQHVYLSDAAANRARSNSYTPPGHTELGPFAHLPSDGPDTLDGLHKHSTPSSENVPSLPPLAFDSSPSSMSFDKEPITPNSPQFPEKASPMFHHANSSAPALSKMTAPMMLTHRSATAPAAKRLTFANNLSVYDTFPASVYDRRSEPATWSRLTPALAQRIKEELNSYKMEEMEVHAASRIHTQFFV